MESDAAIVDTFLHKQDRAYSTDDVLAFVEENELQFKGWIDRGLYNQEWEGLDPDVPERDRWSAIENLTFANAAAPLPHQPTGARSEQHN